MVEANPVQDGPAPVATRWAGRSLYLPTLVIAALAAWLSWRGWIALGQTGVAQSFNAGRFELAGPVILGFVLAICVIEQIRPAQRREAVVEGGLADAVVDHVRARTVGHEAAVEQVQRAHL